jgi:hypothetical protein
MTAGDDPVIGVAGPAPDWQEVETLGLADVIMTILRARRAIPDATAAEVTREKRQTVTHVQVSLRREPPPEPLAGEPGRSPESVLVGLFSARQLDGDLVEAFQGRDVLILK